jgi:general nucleoside transport system ATP-binding protein
MLAVKMHDITKRFGNVLANNHIHFELQQGEIHALLGENGAGKTTLMRILYGLYHADEGEIRVNDGLVIITSPKDALAAGIGMVTQHFTLVPTLTVAENIMLGYTSGFRVSLNEIEKTVSDASQRFGIVVEPNKLVRHLSVGERQRVEILKALTRNVKILIMDEPTAVLVPQEVDDLFASLERLRKSGLSVIFISHKLNEVMTLCDRITVLRDGHVVGTVDKTATNKTDLACMMVGRETFGVNREGKAATGKALLKVEHLSALNLKGLAALKDISFDVKSGEILGIAGVSGNGQSELAQILSGTIKLSSGKYWVDDKEMTGCSVQQITCAGVGRIPEDRHASLVGELTVAENMALEYIDEYIKNGMLDRSRIQNNAVKLIEEYQIKASPTDRIRKLSGGNMQKVILARTLSRKPRVVIASQPTRGLDVGATEYVRHKLLEQRERGAAVLLISEDLDEVLALSDRIAVIYEGQIIGIVPVQDASVAKLGLMMAGEKTH